MKHIIVALALLFGGLSVACAQSDCQYNDYGKVLTQGQWSFCWEQKQDVSTAYVIGNIGYVARSVNLNVTGDTAVPILLPAGYSRFFLDLIAVGNASVSLGAGSTRVGIYTAPSQGGFVVANQQALTAITSSSANANNNMTVLTLNDRTSAAFSGVVLYINVGTANGSAATVDFMIQVRPLS